MLAVRGHDGAQAVATYHGLAPLPAPPLSVAPARPSISAATPRPPRAVVPAVPQPTPALAGITRRTELLSSLLGAKPEAPTDLV